MNTAMDHVTMGEVSIELVEGKPILRHFFTNSLENTSVIEAFVEEINKDEGQACLNVVAPLAGILDDSINGWSIGSTKKGKRIFEKKDRAYFNAIKKDLVMLTKLIESFEYE